MLIKWKLNIKAFFYHRKRPISRIKIIMKRLQRRKVYLYLRQDKCPNTLSIWLKTLVLLLIMIQRNFQVQSLLTMPSSTQKTKEKGMNFSNDFTEPIFLKVNY